MRKLEREMNQAIRGQRNWAGSNTTVFTTDNGLESTVYLHVIILQLIFTMIANFNYLMVVGNLIPLSPD